MEKAEFAQKLKKQMQELTIHITSTQIEQFYTYMQQLIEWNQKINLTAITKPEEIIQKHFVDSATILKHLKKRQKIIDIGTGAGFPGIPIKILAPEKEITLVDSLNKRIKFLDELIQNLELKNTTTIHSRAEELGNNPQHREKYDAVITRAVANMQTLSEYTIPLIKPHGKAIYMKGSQIKEELEKSKKAIKILGGKIEKIEKFTLPNSEIKRTNIIIHKIATTRAKYPRATAQIKKYPL